MFKGWRAEAIEFFEGLEADNSKTYWQAHKPEYETLVLRPMEALLAELAGEFGAGKVFRPYRDVRFSKDKSPYKTNIAAHLGTGGYVSFSADGLGVGTGFYVMEPAQLDRYRRAVADDVTGTGLTGIVDGLAAAHIEVTAHESLKTAPKGYPKDHPRAALLRQKGLVAWKHWEPAAWMGTAKARQRIVDVLHAAAPLVTWLDKHVGPAEERR